MKNWKKESLGIRQETPVIYGNKWTAGSYKWDPAVFQFECAIIEHLRIKHKCSITTCLASRPTIWDNIPKIEKLTVSFLRSPKEWLWGRSKFYHICTDPLHILCGLPDARPLGKVFFASPEDLAEFSGSSVLTRKGWITQSLAGLCLAWVISCGSHASASVREITSYLVRMRSVVFFYCASTFLKLPCPLAISKSSSGSRMWTCRTVKSCFQTFRAQSTINVGLTAGSYATMMVLYRSRIPLAFWYFLAFTP